MACHAVEDYCQKYRIHYLSNDMLPPTYEFNLKTQREGEVVKPVFENEGLTKNSVYLRIKIYLDDCLKTNTNFEFPIDPSEFSQEYVDYAKKAMLDYCEEQEIGCTENGVDEKGIPQFNFHIPQHVKTRILKEQMAIQRKGEEESGEEEK